MRSGKDELHGNHLEGVSGCSIFGPACLGPSYLRPGDGWAVSRWRGLIQAGGAPPRLGGEPGSALLLPPTFSLEQPAALLLAHQTYSSSIPLWLHFGLIRPLVLAPKLKQLTSTGRLQTLSHLCQTPPHSLVIREAYMFDNGLP